MCVSIFSPILQPLLLDLSSYSARAKTAVSKLRLITFQIITLRRDINVNVDEIGGGVHNMRSRTYAV